MNTLSDQAILEVFTVVVLVLLGFDMLSQGRNPRPMKPLRAGLLTLFWVVLALLFGIFIWQSHGPEKGLQFFTGYLIEYALSVDNLFIFVALFGFFQIRAEHQHRILFWGILGAMAMRAVMIVVGVGLVERFGWLLYLFGAFLVFTGIKMLRHHGEQVGNLEQNKLLLFLRKVLPVTPTEHGHRFLVNLSGKWLLTPLALVLVMVEVTDVVFALDSIPAVFAVTQDRLIIFTSNICAILGLRSLYFLLAGGMKQFAYLSVGLSFILMFVGAKMLSKPWFEPSMLVSLGVIVLILALSMIASSLFPPPGKPKHGSTV